MSNYSSITEIQQAIRAKRTNCVALVEHYLAQIASNFHLNIYVEVFAQEALEKARTLDRKFRENPNRVGKLFGMVISLKDVICYESHQVTAGSRILEGFTSLYSATAVERLLAEDAIIIGRVNCDEFGMGSTNENSVYGVTRNAANPEKVPGGSSGASAVSVQADTCQASLGSDTGGSVRQPAGFCGMVGFKPTYGRISRYGLLAYASSFDQIGIVTKSVYDAALLMEIMAGADQFDATCSNEPVIPCHNTLDKETGKFRIAYYEESLNHPGMDEDVKSQAHALIRSLRDNGHQVEPVRFDLLDYMVPAYYVLTTAEASSNLSRYDGIRFGYRTPEPPDIQHLYRKSRSEGFGKEVKRRIMLGTFVLSAGYYDSYYGKAQQVRRLIRERTREIFASYDFILSPSAPTVAWDIGSMADDPVSVYLADIFTVHANLAGIPAICFPAGTDKEGLPIGMQLMADRFEESKLLAFTSLLTSNK